MTTLALLLLIGCATMGTFQRAETLGHGKVELGVELSGWSTAGTGDVLVAPGATGALRYGFLDGVDVGARVGTSGVSADVKFALTPPGARVRVSLAPSVGLAGFSNGHIGGAITVAQAALIVGIRTGPASELTVVPKVHLWGNEEHGHLITLGGSVGHVWPLSRTISVVPELTVMVPATGPVRAVADPFADGNVAVILQGGVGFLFGKQSGQVPRGDAPG